MFEVVMVIMLMMIDIYGGGDGRLLMIDSWHIGDDFKTNNTNSNDNDNNKDDNGADG